MSTYRDLKQLAWEANLELPRQGLVVQSFGNVSAADRLRSVFAIKPSGVSYTALHAEDMVVVDFHGQVVEGARRPSTDAKTHAVLYRHLPQIGGVVHTHSTFATAWAQAGQPIPVLGTTHADYLAVPVPVTPMMPDDMIQGDYEEETGNLIVQTLEALPEPRPSMILVAGHGPFTWGPTPQAAVSQSAALEEIARLALLTRLIYPEIQPLKETLIRKHFERKHGQSAYYGQE